MKRRSKPKVEVDAWLPLSCQGAEAVLAGRLATANALAAKHGIEPPVLTELLPLLLDLPPLICRDAVGSVVGVPIQPKSLSNHDALGTGPRLRFQVSGRIVYPAAFLLEWLETLRLTPVVVKEV